MSTFLPVMAKREIVREARLGSDRTEDAVLKTLRSNAAISSGIRAQFRSQSGRLVGSQRFYCSLNRDAAHAFRRKNPTVAASYAKAAARVEGLDATRALVHEIGLRGVDSTASSLARALVEPDLLELVRSVVGSITAELTRLPSTGDVTTFSGRVVALSTDGALIALDNGGARLPVPRSILDEEGLGQEGAALAARWEMAGDGIMLMVVEPVIDTPEVNSMGQPLVDMYGTPWGRVLTSGDALFAQGLLDRPDSEKQPRATRVRIPIGE